MYVYLLYYNLRSLLQNEMGGACSACGGKERRIQGFGGEALGKYTTWENQEYARI